MIAKETCLIIEQTHDSALLPFVCDIWVILLSIFFFYEYNTSFYIVKDV
jgi:hypothetical protein